MSTVPLEVTEEAAAHVAKLGLQHELEQMLDWVRRNVAALQEIRVAMSSRCSCYGKIPPYVVIWASRPQPPEGTPYDLIEWDWLDWKVQTFPLQVFSVFTLNCT
jgi:hypothetical protein